MSSELARLSIATAARLVRSGEVSPTDLLNASLQEIERHNSTLRAFISVTEETAKKAATAAELLLSAGYDLGPLHGIPLAIKDNIGIRGQRTTAGSKVLENWYPDKDATVIAKLKQAGSVLVGKTNMHEFAWGGTSANLHYGHVRNPWDTSKFPAGSSGGSGAAVAAGLCFGALGTDTGGSIRLPSAINGVVGLRPTYGRVSNAGIIPLAWSMDTAGPMTRTVEDCALIFNAIAGPDPTDPATSPVAVDDYLSRLGSGVRGLRIGVVPRYFFSHLQADVKRAVEQALRTFEGLGAQLIEVDIKHIEGNISAQLTIESAEPSTYHQKSLRERPGDYGDDVRTLLEVGELLLATHYIQAQRYRSVLRAQFIEAFKEVDVFVCPTLPFTATALGATTVVIENGVEEDMLSAIMQFTGVPSLTGLPSLNVPCGFDSSGLPVGMQIIGAPFSESKLFSVGHAFQCATDFHTQSPKLASI